MSADELDNVEDMDMAELQQQEGGPLFWSMKLEANKAHEIDQPAIDGYIVHITNACFGASVNKNSRTVIMVNTDTEASDASLEAPICVLRAGNHENHSLDLLFNESATISLKGTKPSTVYLTGYIQPPVDIDAAHDHMMDPDFEDMTEQEIEQALRLQKQQQMALDDEEEDDDLEDEEEEPQLVDEEEEEEEEQVVEPPKKKQKTNKGARNTKEGKKNADKKRKSPQQKAVKSPQPKAVKSPQQKAKQVDDDDKKEQKKDKKKNKKGGKKMQSMKGGIKYRDMKVGTGDQVSNGDKVGVFYVGQTDDKKVFDKVISGNGFEFNFGKGDVIKGWDLGLKGMRVGGKRKLVIPSKLAYGSNGSPPSIPPNAVLTFTIELKSVN